MQDSFIGKKRKIGRRRSYLQKNIFSEKEKAFSERVFHLKIGGESGKFGLKSR